MLKRLQIIALASAAGLSVSTGALAATAPAHRISMAEARATALKAAPGKILSSKYEKERGRSEYSFNIREKHGTRTVDVDARTGKIMHNTAQHRSRRPEQRAEARTAHHPAMSKHH